VVGLVVVVVGVRVVRVLVEKFADVGEVKVFVNVVV
jgi:hypothetical protein